MIRIIPYSAVQLFAYEVYKVMQGHLINEICLLVLCCDVDFSCFGIMIFEKCAFHRNFSGKRMVNFLLLGDLRQELVLG